MTAQFSTTPLPLSLGGTSVSINGSSGPLLYVSPGQVNAQVPYETKVGTAKLIVTSNGVPSPRGELRGGGHRSWRLHPTAKQSRPGAEPGRWNPQCFGDSGAPRTVRDRVSHRSGTGQSRRDHWRRDAVESPFPGARCPRSGQDRRQIADLPFAGLAPGFNGLLQMNVLIPDVPPGELSFDVSVGGVAAAPTVISIAPKL